MIANIEAYITAASSLKSMRTSAGLSVESVEEAREVFTEEMELQEEISDALLQPLNSADQAGDEELLSELNTLMAADNVASTFINLETPTKSISTDEIDVNQLLPDLSSMSLSEVTQVRNHNTEVETDNLIKTAEVSK